MPKQITYFRRRPDLTPEEFRDHWMGTHADVVRGLPGIARYVQNHAIAPVRGDGDPPYHGAAEIWFDDVDVMRANVGSDALARIRADEANFIDLDSMDSMVANEHTIIDTEPSPGARKLIGLVKAQASYSPEQFQDAYRNQLGPLVQKVPGIDRYVQSHSRLGIYAKITPRFDAVAELWFAADDRSLGSAEMAAVQSFEAGLIDFTKTELCWVEHVEIEL